MTMMRGCFPEESYGVGKSYGYLSYNVQYLNELRFHARDCME